MPATSSRISASSSTIRMSDAMTYLPVACCFAIFRSRFFGRGGVSGGKTQPHPGAAATRRDLRGIVELDAAAVVLEDAPHDGEAEAGPLLARRHIGLEQAAAVLLGK